MNRIIKYVLIFFTLFCFQRCSFLELYYIDDNDATGMPLKLNDVCGLGIDYLQEGSRIDTKEEDDEYEEKLIGILHFTIGVTCRNGYTLKSFNLRLRDGKSGRKIKWESVYYNRKYPLIVYKNIEDMIKKEKLPEDFDFDIVYDRNDVEGLADAVVEGECVFERNSKEEMVTFRQKIHRKLNFDIFPML